MTHTFIQRFAIALLPVFSCVLAQYSYYGDYEPFCYPSGFCHCRCCPYDSPPDTTADSPKFKPAQAPEARKK